MAQYSVAGPDGSIIDLTGPDGASEEQIKAEAHKIYLTNQETQKTKQAEAAQATAAQQAEVNKNAESPAITFASKAVNALGFGLPEYLDKKFGTPGRVGQELWQSPEQRQQFYANAEAANPNAARYGDIAGQAAGIVIPGALGAKAGFKAASSALANAEKNALYNAGSKAMARGQVEGIEALTIAGKELDAAKTAYYNTFTPEAGRAVVEAQQIYNALLAPIKQRFSGFVPTALKTAAGGAGAGMGAQLGAALPDVAQGDMPGAVAKSAEMNNTINQIPAGIGPVFSNTVGQIVPAGLAAASQPIQSARKSLDEMIRELAAKYALGTPGQTGP
jgi:hypothetical protein